MSQTLTYTEIEAASRRTPRFLDQLFRDTAYSLTALPIGIVTFTLVVTGIAVGVGTAIIWVGIPILIGTLLVSRAFAHLERIRLRTLQGRQAPTPEYVVRDPEAGFVPRMFTPMRDPQSWIDTAWGLVSFVTSLVAFTVTVTWWAAVGSGLTYWFWERWLPEDGDNTTLAELIGLDGRNADIWLNLGIGAFALLTLPFVVRAFAAMHGGLADAMLSGRAQLQARSTDG
jgi:hypothetical protein